MSTVKRIYVITYQGGAHEVCWDREEARVQLLGGTADEPSYGEWAKDFLTEAEEAETFSVYSDLFDCHLSCQEVPGNVTVTVK